NQPGPRAAVFGGTTYRFVADPKMTTGGQWVDAKGKPVAGFIAKTLERRASSPIERVIGVLEDAKIHKPGQAAAATPLSHAWAYRRQPMAIGFPSRRPGQMPRRSSRPILSPDRNSCRSWRTIYAP